MTKAESDARGPGDVWSRRRERVAREIERAALDLFAAHGPDDVTVEQIAEAADISVRTFYRYFSNRDEIMYVVPRRWVAEMCEHVSSQPATESIIEAFLRAVREIEESFTEDELARLWGRAMTRWAPAVSGPQSGNEMTEAFAGVAADRLGLSPHDVRVQVIATAIASVVWLGYVRWLTLESHRSIPEVLEECIEVLRDLDRHWATRP